MDTLTGHLALTAYLLAVTDERVVWQRLKKLPPLLLSSLIALLLSVGLHTIPELIMVQYFISSFAVLIMCTLWVRWAWQFRFWQALASCCMASIFQMAESTLSIVLLWQTSLEETFPFTIILGGYLFISIAAALLLYRLRFGKWFRLLLDNEASARQTALLLFALEAVMEVLLRLGSGVQPRFLMFYYLLAAATVILMAMLVIHLAQRFDTARKIQAQQDIIAQQQLYEQDLEDIRRDVRAFRHDYKNLLAVLSEQAGTGELEGLRHTLAELDADFDQRLGRKIQTSAQIGNLQIPEVRSLLLSKLTAMHKNGVECRLEVLYPVVSVNMNVWVFVRCLGILTDNAAEAALETERPWVEIVLLAQNGRVFFRVSNPYINIIEPEKMWNNGWSTKGPGRGLGLPGYQRILDGSTNTSSFTSWENGIFVQELSGRADYDRNLSLRR